MPERDLGARKPHGAQRPCFRIGLVCGRGGKGPGGVRANRRGGRGRPPPCRECTRTPPPGGPAKNQSMTTDPAFGLRSARGRLAVAAVTGDVTCPTASALYERGHAVIDSGHPVLVLDLSGAGQVDSSTLSALLALRQYARAAGGTLALAAIPERLDRMLALTGVQTLLRAHSTAEQAAAALVPGAGTSGGRAGDIDEAGLEAAL